MTVTGYGGELIDNARKSVLRMKRDKYLDSVPAAVAPDAIDGVSAGKEYVVEQKIIVDAGSVDSRQ